MHNNGRAMLADGHKLWRDRVLPLSNIGVVLPLNQSLLHLRFVRGSGGRLQESRWRQRLARGRRRLRVFPSPVQGLLMFLFSTSILSFRFDTRRPPDNHRERRRQHACVGHPPVRCVSALLATSLIPLPVLAAAEEADRIGKYLTANWSLLGAARIAKIKHTSAGQELLGCTKLGNKCLR